MTKHRASTESTAKEPDFNTESNLHPDTVAERFDSAREDEKEMLDDGFGNVWEKCGPDCCLEIVRPGKVQCEAEDCPFRTERGDPSYYP